MDRKQLKQEIIKQSAYMVLCDFAFVFQTTPNFNGIEVIWLKEIKQRSVYVYSPSSGNFDLKTSTMSEANKYYSMALLERNKEFLKEGMTL